MFRTFMIVAGITVGFPLVAAAEPTAQEVIQTKDMPMVHGYVVGVGRGFEWANADLTSRKQPALYCAPGNLAVVGQQYIAMLEQQVSKRPDQGKLPASIVLLRALKETFPCP
jgi:hypothetical protein